MGKLTYAAARSHLVAGFMFNKFLNKIKYGDTSYKIFLFLITLIFGTAITYGNWVVGLIAGIIVVMSKEINDAYDKGRKDKHK